MRIAWHEQWIFYPLQSIGEKSRFPKDCSKIVMTFANVQGIIPNIATFQYTRSVFQVKYYELRIWFTVKDNTWKFHFQIFNLWASFFINWVHLSRSNDTCRMYYLVHINDSQTKHSAWTTYEKLVLLWQVLRIVSSVIKKLYCTTLYCAYQWFTNSNNNTSEQDIYVYIQFTQYNYIIIILM